MIIISVSQYRELKLECDKFVLTRNPPGVLNVINRNFGNIAYVKGEAEYYVNDRLVAVGPYKVLVFKHCYIIYNLYTKLCEFIDIETNEVFKTTNKKYIELTPFRHTLKCITKSDNMITLGVDYTCKKNCECCRKIMDVEYTSMKLVVTKYYEHGRADLPTAKFTIWSGYSLPFGGMNTVENYIWLADSHFDIDEIIPGKLFTLIKVDSEIGVVFKLVRLHTHTKAALRQSE